MTAGWQREVTAWQALGFLGVMTLLLSTARELALWRRQAGIHFWVISSDLTEPYGTEEGFS